MKTEKSLSEMTKEIVAVFKLKIKKPQLMSRLNIFCTITLLIFLALLHQHALLHRAQ